MTDSELSNIIKRISAFVGLGDVDKLTFYKRDGKFHFKIFSSKLYLPKEVSKAIDDKYKNHLYDEPNNNEAIKDSLSDIIEDIKIDTDEGFIDFVPVDQMMVVAVNDSYIRPFNKKKLMNDDVILMPKARVLSEEFLQNTFGYHEILHEDDSADASDGTGTADTGSSEQTSTSQNKSNETNQENEADKKDEKSEKPLVLLVTSLRMPLTGGSNGSSTGVAFGNIYKVLRNLDTAKKYGLDHVYEELNSGADFMIGFADYDASAETTGDWLVQSYVRLSGIDNNSNAYGVFYQTKALEAIKSAMGQDFKNSQFQILNYENSVGIKKRYKKIYVMSGPGSATDIKNAGLTDSTSDNKIELIDLDDGLIKDSPIDTHVGNSANLANVHEVFREAYAQFNKDYVKKGAFDPELTATDADDKATGDSKDAETVKNEKTPSNSQQTQTQSTNTQQASNNGQSTTASNNAGAAAPATGATAQVSDSVIKKSNRSWWLREDNAAQASASQDGATGAASQSEMNDSAKLSADIQKIKRVGSKVLDPAKNVVDVHKKAVAKKAYADWMEKVNNVVGSTTSNLITLIGKNLYWAPGFANDKDKFNAINNVAKTNEQKRGGDQSSLFQASWKGLSADDVAKHTEFGLRATSLKVSKNEKEKEDLSQLFAMYCCTDQKVKNEIDTNWPGNSAIDSPDSNAEEKAKKARDESNKANQANQEDQASNEDEDVSSEVTSSEEQTVEKTQAEA